jgi:hypothetical protein
MTLAVALSSTVLFYLASVAGVHYLLALMRGLSADVD